MTFRSLRNATLLLCALPLIWTACGGSDSPESSAPDPSLVKATPPAAKAPAPAPAPKPTPTAAATAPPTLVDIEWKLVAIEPKHGDAISPVPAAVPTLQFVSNPGPNGELRVMGFSGCNRFFSNYTVGDDGSLSLPVPLAMTKAACPDPVQQVEATLMMSLGATSGYSLGDGELILRGANGSLRFSGG